MKPSASPRALTTRRYVHLWFPRLATDRERRRRPLDLQRPLVLVEKVKGALRLAAVDEAASREGLAAGMTLGDARAQVPSLAVRRAEPVADLGLLARLAEGCRRFTPILALHAPDGVDLDVTGCTDLFGGEPALLALMGERFGAFALGSALADTPALAWAVARYGGGGVVASGAGEAVLAALPVAALGLQPEAVRVLAELGLRRVGQLLDLPRAALGRRLGESALHRLDAALGRRSDPLVARLEPQPLRAERRVFEPVADEAQVLQVTGDLARDLAEALGAKGLGGRRFRLELFRVDGAVKRLEVCASRPLADPARIADLFAERLAGLNEGLEADFGFDQFRLAAVASDSLRPRAHDLLARSGPGQGEEPGRGLSDLGDRLTARTGAQLLRPAPGDAHDPGRAAVTHALAAPPPAWAGEVAPVCDGAPLRPLRLFEPPQPVENVLSEAPDGAPARFTWRRVARTVVRAEGPERLEPQWGAARTGSRVRDYYRLEDAAGRRYWLFREGRFDAPDVLPPGAAPLPSSSPVAKPAGLEPIRPVRPPPDPPPHRFLLPKIKDVTSAGVIHLRAPVEPSPATPDGEEPQRPPQPPRWFVHGLFG